MSEWLSFRAAEPAHVLTTWWYRLDDARRDRAELRRCHIVSNVAFCPSFHHLRLALLPFGKHNVERLAIVAGVLAHIKVNDASTTFAAQMAVSRDGGDQPRLSDLRFRRLLKIDDLSVLHGEFIRITRLLGGSINIVDLAETIINWNKNVKKQLAYIYYEQVTKTK